MHEFDTGFGGVFSGHNPLMLLTSFFMEEVWYPEETHLVFVHPGLGIKALQIASDYSFLWMHTLVKQIKKVSALNSM